MGNIIWSQRCQENPKKTGLVQYNLNNSQKVWLLNENFSSMSYNMEKQSIIGVIRTLKDGIYSSSVMEYNLATASESVLINDRIRDIGTVERIEYYGEKVIFLAKKEGIGTLYFYDLSGSVLEEICKADKESGRGFQIGSSGKCLYFLQDETLYRLNLLTHKKKLLLNSVTSFEISHDEKKIAYAMNARGLYLYDIETEKNRNLVSVLGGEIFRFSPDDSMIVYMDRKANLLEQLVNSSRDCCKLYNLVNEKIYDIYEWNSGEYVDDIIWK